MYFGVSNTNHYAKHDFGKLLHNTSPANDYLSNGISRE